MKLLPGLALSLAMMLTGAGPSVAQQAPSPEPSPEVVEAVRAAVEARLPGIPVATVESTPIEGLYEIVSDGQVYYVNEDASHLLDGSLIDLASRENLTERRLGALHVDMIEAVGAADMLVYEADGDSDRSITVFTDISCGYCRRLHEDIDDLLSAGVSVRYLLFPRAGLGSQAHADLESVWCADDPQAAMTRAKAGEPIEPAQCDNPIESHVALAERLGLRGTPLIYLDTGERVPGYRAPEQLAQAVNDGTPLAD